jgi:hypothetical protein
MSQKSVHLSTEANVRLGQITNGRQVVTLFNLLGPEFYIKILINYQPDATIF